MKRFLIFLCLLALPVPHAAVAGPSPVTYRASEESATTEPNGRSTAPSLSADGRYVAFLSEATNLTAGDTNTNDDVYVRDLKTGKLVLASVDSQGNAATGSGASISDDGRYVAFSSFVALSSKDTNNTGDVYIRDLQRSTTVLASAGMNGRAANGQSSLPFISGDGRYVLFESDGTDLVAKDKNKKSDLFVRDLKLGKTVLVTQSSRGAAANASSVPCGISKDGRKLVFVSEATTLVDGDSNESWDVFVADRDADGNRRYDEPKGRSVRRVSVGPRGKQVDNRRRGGADVEGCATISRDGSTVAFWSYSDQIDPHDANGGADVFVYDVKRGVATLATVGPKGEPADGPSGGDIAISSNGALIVFHSSATNLVPGAVTSGWQTFVRDVKKKSTSLVSVSSEGLIANGQGVDDAISADGKVIAFDSGGDNLIPCDSNQKGDLFIRDLRGGSPPRDFAESGPVSKPVHDTGEPEASRLPSGEILRKTLHTQNCELIVAHEPH